MNTPLTQEQIRDKMRKLLHSRENSGLNMTAILDLMVESYKQGSKDTADYLETGKAKR